ncbi:MAG TPA: class I SAM-dependent methyltransferase [Caulobacteraceae bacterium]|jgi:ubiquinone/menaquinone biosynthesis C-methylase UbiE
MNSKPAFAIDRSVQAIADTFKAAWWGAAGLAARSLANTGRTAPAGFAPTADPAPEGFVRRAWQEAFEKDRQDVASGLYPPANDGPANPAKAIADFLDLVSDARVVEQRRARGGGADIRQEELGGAYPPYYRQNFHYQTGGWFTEDSARRYEAQVEALFAGAAGAMRRRALSLLASAWRERDHRDLKLADIACGSGAFLKDLKRTFPRARLFGCDLSEVYLREARRASGIADLVQASAERLPFANESLDAISCIFLFHELPRKVRRDVAVELARVLKPGGLVAFADSLQPVDEPRLERLLQVFPAYFHEPYYADYAATDLPGLFAEAGLEARAHDEVFLTKAILFEKA